MSCKECHWFKDDNPYEVMSNGKMYPCTNIGESGWEHWDDTQTEPAYCSQYCKKGTYKPTGIWAQVAKVVEAVAEVVENDRQVE